MTNQSPSPSAPAGGFDRSAALKSIGQSLAINALCPFLLYRILEPHFPLNSLMPLLYATIFPVIGLTLSLVRKRTVDAIGIIVMVGLALHIVVTLLAPNVGVALVIRSLDGAVIGLALVISALIGRPILLLVAKQVVAGANSERAASFNRMNDKERVRGFSTITLVWGIGLMAMSGLHLVLALKLAPAEFLLVSPVVGLVTIVALLVWTGRYLAARRHAIQTPAIRTI